jgi:hypothetical protein
MELDHVEDVGTGHVAEGQLYTLWMSTGLQKTTNWRYVCWRIIIYVVYAEVKDLESQVFNEVQMQYTF